MPTARVVAVAPDSAAALAGLAPGDELLSVNGEAVRDVIRYQILTDDAHVDLEVRRGGLERQISVDKVHGAPLGLQLSSPVFDRIRTCDNHCPFCFIYQLPPGMRPSLSVKDDDYRLSFLYGNFTTLTRFTEADLERVVTERLGPLYVSIHATDPDLRSRLLRNRRGATSLRWLAALLDAGIEVHGQVVVCPGLNDGAALDDTMLGILDRFPRLRTAGVVPLGVSAHTTEPDLRSHTRAEVDEVLRVVETWQGRFLDALGRRLVFAADEYYLLGDRPFPATAEYEDMAQHENGIGMATTFADEVEAALATDTLLDPRHVDGRRLDGRRLDGRRLDGRRLDGTGASARTRSGFFASVDGAPATGYRSIRVRAETSPDAETSVAAAPSAAGETARRPVTILTGEYGARVLAPLTPRFEAVAGAPVRVLPIENRFFGGNISVTGLLTSADIARVLEHEPSEHRYLLPDVVLSEGRFLDDGVPADLPKPVEMVPTDGGSLIAALRR